jgi:hypothetical protein
MAQKVIVEIVDDLDGSVISDGTGGTVAFSIEGKSYEIDLSGENTEKLYSALEPYIEKARTISSSAPKRRNSSSNSSSSASRDRLQEMREWAQSNGHKVATRGRISREVQEAFERARS